MSSAYTVAAGGLQSYEQALAYLRQQQYELAFVAAKQALDVAGTAGQGPSRRVIEGASHSSQLMHCAQCWLALAAAAAGMGDAELAYHLYARGHAQLYDAAQAAGALSSNVHYANQQQQRQQQLELLQLVKQQGAGKLEMLSAMCEVPPLAHYYQQQQQQYRSKGHHKPASAFRLQQQHHASSKGWQQLHERFSLSSSSNSKGTRSRVFCVSDVHVDSPGGGNMSWVKRISSTSFKNDVLIVAGDVGDTAAAVQTAFKLLAPKFRRVVWVPGNHEAWLRPGSMDKETYPDSFSKLLALRQIARSCGVDVGPIEVSPGLSIVPLMSWYNCQFDTADPRPGRYRHDSFCSWLVPEDDVWQVMMKLNTQTLALVTQRTAELRGHTNNSSSSSNNPAANTQQQLSRQMLQQQVHSQPNTGLCRTASSRSSCSSGGSRVQNDCSSGSGSSSSSGGSKVTWNETGVLAVQSEKKVPGLQINLHPRIQKQLQQQPLQQLLPQQRCESEPTVLQLPGTAADNPVLSVAAANTTGLTSQEQLLQHHCEQAQQQHAGPLQTARAAASAGESHLSLPSQQQQQAEQHRTDQAGDRAATASAVVAKEQPLPVRGMNSKDSKDVPPIVITVSHFLPHPALPHHHVSELSKAMGCLQLQMQLQQVASTVHVYGHSHVNTDVVLPTPKEYTVGLSVATPALHGGRSCSHEASVSSGVPESQPHQVGSNKHVGGMCLGIDDGGAYDSAARCSGGSIMPGHRRYVQYALDAVDACAAGLYCLWDGEKLTAPGHILAIEGP